MPTISVPAVPKKAGAQHLVVLVAVLILVGKQNTQALSAELVDLVGAGGAALIDLLKKAAK